VFSQGKNPKNFWKYFVHPKKKIDHPENFRIPIVGDKKKKEEKETLPNLRRQI